MSDKVKIKLKPQEGVKVKVKAGSLQSALSKLAKLRTGVTDGQGTDGSGSDQGI